MHQRDPLATRGLALGAGTLAALLLSGCVEHHYHCPAPSADASSSSLAYYGPPASVSHGTVYYDYDQDVTLVFDADWGGYWVRDYPEEYYSAGAFYRWYGGRWHRGGTPRGPWVLVDIRELPGRLDRHHMRIARGDAQDTWRDPDKARKDSARERDEHERDARKEQRDQRHEEARDERDDGHDAARDGRDDRRDDADARRDQQHEARDDAREGRRDDPRAAHAEPKDDRRPETDERHEPRQQPPSDPRWNQREARQEAEEPRHEARPERVQKARPQPSGKPRKQDAVPAKASEDDDDHKNRRDEDEDR